MLKILFYFCNRFELNRNLEELHAIQNQSHADDSDKELVLHKYFMNIAIIISQNRKKIKHQVGLDNLKLKICRSRL